MAVFGETLRQARAYKGVTLREAEQATRINRHHLAALEDENFGALPPLIYQRGIVRNYAVFLDLDPNKVLTMFEDAHGSATTTGSIPVAVKPLEMPSTFTPNFAIIAFMVVLSAIVFAWVYSVYRGPDEVLPTPTMQTTVTPMSSREAAAPIVATATATATPEDEEASSASTPEVDLTATAEAEIASRPMSEANARRTQVAEQEAERSATQAPTATTEVTAASDEDAEPTARATATPDVAATEEAEELAAAEAESAQATEQAVADSLLTVSFEPIAPVYLTVYGDGVLLWDGNVAAGQTVGPFNAGSFEVYTSDFANTYITNHDTGQTFYMPQNSFTLNPI